jgi:hypothetical protein
MYVSSDADRRQVLVLTADLMFRAKLMELLRGAGYEPLLRGTAPHALVELSGESDVRRVQELVKSGTAVVAFAAHVRPSLLKAAKAAGAEAVPNSRIEATVRERFPPR